METLTIKVENMDDAIFLRELLGKFKFVKEIETSNGHEDFKEQYRNMPIQWATEKPSIKVATSVVKDRKLTLTEIRDKAWKRSL